MKTTITGNSEESMTEDSVTVEQHAQPPRRVVMLSLHTSPLAQAGCGDAGGLNVYVNALSRALAAQGCEVDIVTTDLDETYDDGAPGDSWRTLDDGRRVHVLEVCSACREDKSRLLECLDDLGRRALKSLSAASALPVDVVHSHYWISGLAGLTLTQHLDCDLVHTMHTIGAIKRERDPEAQEDPRRHQAEQRIVAAAAQLTANTLGEAADLQRIFGVPAERITLVAPGTDLAVFHPPRGEDPRLEPLQNRPLRLTFAGRLQPHKGPQVAVAAVGWLRQVVPEITAQLTVAGRQSGADEVDIVHLAQQSEISDVVVLTEPVPHPELAELFRTSDAVLVPSYSESFGLVALEAMACGTPVLAHRVGGLAELVQHKETGALIDSLDPQQWAEHIAGLATDRNHWRRCSEGAAALAQQYSWESTAQQSLTAYRAASVQVARTPG